MKEKIIKNKLIQYKGGGYDGCFWEWNFCYFDEENEFHDIVSTGRNGCDTKEKILKFINEGKDYFMFNLNKKADIKDFTEGSQSSQVVFIAKWLAENQDIYLMGLCKLCEQEFNLEEAITVNPKHYGGIAYSNEDKVCEECYCVHSCSYCGEYFDDDSNFNKEGYCEYCQEDKNSK